MYKQPYCFYSFTDTLHNSIANKLQKINDVRHIGKVFLTTLNKRSLLSSSKLFVTLSVFEVESLFKLPKKQKKGIKPFQLKTIINNIFAGK